MSASSIVINRLFVYLFVFALSFAIFSCKAGDDSADDDAQETDDSADDSALDSADDASDDDAPDIEEELRKTLEEYVIFTGEPGISIGYRLKDYRQRLVAAGEADLRTHEPLLPGMTFRAGSLTKVATAVLVWQLADEGLLSVDDPLTDYLPEYPQWSAVTIRHLLGMRSGIPDYLFDQVFYIGAFLRMGKYVSPEMLVSYIAEDPLEFEPGQECSYSNTNYILLGMVIERVTGHPAEAEIAGRIAAPLGLKRTFLDVTGEPIEGLAHGYADATLAGPMLGVDADLLMTLITLVTSDLMVDGNTFDGTYLMHPSLFWTTGSLISTPEDLAAMMKALFDGDLVSDEALAEMTSHEVCDVLEQIGSVGPGFMYTPTEFGDMYGHDGWNFGYYSAAYYLPDEDFAYAHIHNFIPAQKEGLDWEIRSMVLGGAPGPREVCRPPDNFFDLPPGADLAFRFKGLIGEESSATPFFGYANVKTLKDEPSVLYHGAISKVVAAAGGLRIETYSPSGVEGFDDRAAFLGIGGDILSQLKTESVFEFLEGAPPDLTLYDAVMDEPELSPVKLCVTGVADPARTSRISLCDHAKASAAPGASVKLFGTFSTVTNKWAVRKILRERGLPLCSCKNPDGVWEPCE